MTVVAVVSSMHEHMHQWTGEQHQPRQRAKQMGTVLGPKEPASHCRQYQTADAEARSPEWWR
jgi:hypothetical protein